MARNNNRTAVGRMIAAMEAMRQPGYKGDPKQDIARAVGSAPTLNAELAKDLPIGPLDRVVELLRRVGKVGLTIAEIAKHTGLTYEATRDKVYNLAQENRVRRERGKKEARFRWILLSEQEVKRIAAKRERDLDIEGKRAKTFSTEELVEGLEQYAKRNPRSLSSVMIREAARRLRAWNPKNTAT